MKITKTYSLNYLKMVNKYNPNICLDSMVKTVNNISKVYNVSGKDTFKFIFNEISNIPGLLSKIDSDDKIRIENFLNNFGLLYYHIKSGGNPKNYWEQFKD